MVKRLLVIAIVADGALHMSNWELCDDCCSTFRSIDWHSEVDQSLEKQHGSIYFVFCLLVIFLVCIILLNNEGASVVQW